MIIDRHNYEEVFILYWDNELTAAQKQAVENFVNQNADLQEEFNILGETRFTPDDIQFEEKAFLQNNYSINITNYEEQLLNYIDDELSNEEKKEVEKAVSKYPVIQKEFSLLQRTKLQPESIVFPDKTSLYRREEKVRVISMTWFRVAVAAAIILIAGLITFRLVNNGSNGDKVQIVKNFDNKSNPTTTPPVTQPSIQPQKEENSLVKQDNKSQPEKKTTEKKAQNVIVEDKLPGNVIAVNTTGNKNNLPKEGIGKTLTESNTIPEEAVVKIDKKEFSSPNKTETGVINTSPGKSDVTLQAKPALYIPEAEQKEKGGLKEFLRKTTRVFERRTKIQTTTDDNKLLVGAFAVSLK